MMGPGFGDHIVSSVKAFIVLVVGIALVVGALLGWAVPLFVGWLVNHVRWVS